MSASPTVLAREAGIAPSTVLRRLSAGMTLEEALAKGSPRRRIGTQVNNFEVVSEIYKKTKKGQRRALQSAVMRCLSCGTEKKVAPGEKPGCTDCSNAKRRRMFEVHGQQLSLAEVCSLYSIKRTTFMHRIEKGMSAVEAATSRKRT